MKIDYDELLFIEALKDYVVEYTRTELHHHSTMKDVENKLNERRTGAPELHRQPRRHSLHQVSMIKSRAWRRG